MIAAHSLSISFGGDELFNDISFTINPGDRVGLVGSNGAGKSTLMKILLGIQQPDDGRVVAGRHAVIGYLPQEGIVLSGDSVRDEVMKAFKEVVELQQAVEELSTQVGQRSHEGDTPEFKALLNELGEVQHRFEALNGFAAEGEVEKVLMGLGFSPEDMERSCSEFSGGWQMRIELAKLLLRQPDLLMLDEPTNHLDIESLTWLEGFLMRYSGGILLISHDRAFLDALTNRTFEISRGRLTAYTGNYAKYLVEREHRRELQQSAYDNQQKMIADTQRFIDRFRYKATKAVQVQSRIKALERLDRIAPPESDEARVFFKFPPAPRSGRDVVVLEGLSKRYGDNLVLDSIDLVIERGEHIAFLGRNGEGKSTLSRIIAGSESYEGKRTIGSNVTIGYYAQHQAEELDPGRTVLETLDAVATGDIRTQLRSLLGTFLFHGDDVFKPVRVLSGGEKSRLALAKMLLEPANLLILDEPTNHLDMQSKGVLKRALLEFDGAIILVSHDRAFLEGLANKCIEFKHGSITEHLSGIDEYLRKRQSESIDTALGGRSRPTSQQRNDASNGEDNGISRKEQKRLEAERRNRRYAATKKLRASLAKVEKSIGELEEEKAECEQTLARPDTYDNPDRMLKLQDRLSEIDGHLSGHYSKWERLAKEIEEVEADLE
jgi:ATP-binding cassette subfamily F protein 3